MDTTAELEATIYDMVQAGKGILAADESAPTIAKRFSAINVESTEQNRRTYRSMLFGTPGLDEFVSAVILFEETLTQQSNDGIALPEVLASQGIVPGIKVDKGLQPLANAAGDKVTQGLDGLAERLQTYKTQGARFAKWREVYPISPRNPTALGLDVNAEMLARYAAICQTEGFVPIVEPEVLIDGNHSIERSAEVIETVLHSVFHALHRHRVVLECIVLKPSMVTPGKESSSRATPEQVAEATLKVFRRVVPAAVPSINFLSGGQTPEEATANLNAMNALYKDAPWELSFSYGRALQEPALKAWQGKAENVAATQQALYQRAFLNGAARTGDYTPAMETESFI